VGFFDQGKRSKNKTPQKPKQSSVEERTKPADNLQPPSTPKTIMDDRRRWRAASSVAVFPASHLLGRGITRPIPRSRGSIRNTGKAARRRKPAPATRRDGFRAPPALGQAPRKLPEGARPVRHAPTTGGGGWGVTNLFNLLDAALACTRGELDGI